MVPLEYNGGAASGMTEIIVFGVLALAIVALGLLMMRSLRKVRTPREDFIFPEREPEGAEDRAAAPSEDPGEAAAPRPGGPEDGAPRS